MLTTRTTNLVPREARPADPLDALARRINDDVGLGPAGRGGLALCARLEIDELDRNLRRRHEPRDLRAETRRRLDRARVALDLYVTVSAGEGVAHRAADQLHGLSDLRAPTAARRSASREVRTDERSRPTESPRYRRRPRLIAWLGGDAVSSGVPP